MTEQDHGIEPDQGDVETDQDEKKSGKALALWAYLAPLITFVLIIGVWYFISYVRMDAVRRRTALPAPHTVFEDGLFVWEDRRGLKPILEALLVTSRVALIGLAISIAIGVLLAIVMNTAKWAERSIFPYAVIIQVTPILALVPLIRNWYGFGIPARVVVCVLIAIFPVITNTLFGLQSAKEGHHDLVHSPPRQLVHAPVAARDARGHARVPDRPADRGRRKRHRCRRRRLLLPSGPDRISDA